MPIYFHSKSASFSIIIKAAFIAGDRQVLVDLYSTGGIEWDRKSGWNSSAALSDWDGVKVDDNGRVTVLYLPFNKLAGSTVSLLIKLINLYRNYSTFAFKAELHGEIVFEQ